MPTAAPRAHIEGVEPDTTFERIKKQLAQQSMARAQGKAGPLDARRHPGDYPTLNPSHGWYQSLKPDCEQMARRTHACSLRLAHSCCLCRRGRV